MKESSIKSSKVFISLLVMAVLIGLGVIGFHYYADYQDKAAEAKNNNLRKIRKIVPIVSASSSGDTAEAWSAAKAIDNNPTTGWSTPPRLRPQEEFLQLDLGTVVDIATVSWLPSYGNPYLGPAQFTIEVSSDGVKWVPIVSKQDYKPKANVWFTTSFDPVPARYVKLKSITPSFKDSPWPGKYMLQIMEFEVRSPQLQ